MADITVTAGNVLPASGYGFTDGTAGEALTRGQVVYLKSSDNKYWKAKNNASSTATVAGIVLQDVAASQPVRIQTSGSINPGATVAVGTRYFLSGTFGGICPHGDMTSNMYVSYLGTATTTSNIALQIHNTGAMIP